MTAWIIKRKRSRNDWSKMLAPGSEDEWETRRHRNDLAPGDPVFIWESSPGLRVIATAQVVQVRPKNRTGDTFFTLRYATGHLENPVGMDQLRADLVMTDASFLKPGAAGTLYDLTPVQADRLTQLIAGANTQAVEQTLRLPDAVVRNVLPFVAESIKRANELEPAKWGVSPFEKNGLRLNVGFVEVLTVDSNSSGFLVESASIPSTIAVEKGYAKVRGSGRVVIPTSKARSWLQMLRKTHDSALGLASKTQFNPGAAKAHRDWIVEEIERLTKTRLPRPTYDGSKGRLVDDGSDVERDSDFFEGNPVRVLVTQYERDRNARDKCIRHYGPACFICGMTFAEVYGPEMKGFIHVHHVTPIHVAGREYEVDPIEDLRPLCPNCHTAVHHTTPPRTMEEMKALVARRARS